MKILLVADVHNRPHGSRYTLWSLKRIFNKLRPELIVFLGDTVHGPAVKKNYEKYLRQVLDLTGDIPFATVFGNHDDECDTSKEEILKIISSYKNSLTNGRDYLIEMNGEALLFIDSGTYYDGDESLYDIVKPEQIDFALSKIKGKKAILFQHIIIPDIMECIDVFEQKEKGAIRDGKKYYRFKDNIIYTGKLGECPCPPSIKTNQLEALAPYLKGMCFGHDHKNTFELMMNDVKIIQCGGCGSNSYDKLCRSNVKLLDTKTMTTQIYYI